MPLKGSSGAAAHTTEAQGSGSARISLVKFPENWFDRLPIGSLDFGDIARVLSGVGFPRFPVGKAIDRRDLPKPARISLPTLVPTTGTGPPKGVFREDPRGSFPQIKEVLPVQAPVALPQVRTGPPSEDGGPRTTEIHTGADMGLDLGSILGGIGEFIPGPDFFDLGGSMLGFGGTQNIPSAAPTQVPTVMTAPAVQQTSSAPTYQGGTYGGGCEPDPRNQYVMKFICGQWKWVKKRKRRSKRLATASDIKDLSALQGVLGSGKNLTTWIATHR